MIFAFGGLARGAMTIEELSKEYLDKQSKV
jgi:hypothetical protein